MSWRNCCGVVISAALAATCGIAKAANQISVHTPGTRITAEFYDLHILITIAVLAIFCVAFGVMLHSITTHRGTTGSGNPAGQFQHYVTLETFWTVIPFFILLGVAWPATRNLVALKDASNADITIKATGMQWKWGYEYLKGDGEGISFFSNLYAPRRPAVDSTTINNNNFVLDVDNPVVVPVNKKIRMVLTANDAIHSWHIPALGVKQDAIPGLARDTWFNTQKIGTFRGLCSAESCGAGRACVLIVVNVVDEGDYRKWVDGKKRNVAAIAGNASEKQAVGAQTPRDEKLYAAN